MEQLSIAELTELFFMREAVIDDQFQFWISITFAVIVANFVAGRRLSLRSRYAVALLYALAVFVLASKWYYVATDTNALRDQMRVMGLVIEVPVMTVVSRIILFVLGSAATLVFLLSNWLRDDQDAPAP